MTPLGWLALGGACGVLALPPPAGARAERLAGAGRLRPSAGAIGWSSSLRAALRRRWCRRVGVPAAGAVLLQVALRTGPAPVVVIATVAFVAAVLVRDAVRERRNARRHRALLTAVRVLAGELSAGAAPADALAAAAATGPDARVLGSVGAPSPTAAEVPDPAVRAVAAAWALAGTTGAALAGVIDRVADDLAARGAQRRAVAVAVAGPRASAVMLALLPAVGLLLGAAMGARPLEFLLADPIGQLVCCAGVLLDAAGVLWVRRIVARVR